MTGPLQLPDRANGKDYEALVLAEEFDPLDQALGGQQPVKRIAVLYLKSAGSERMSSVDLEVSNTQSFGDGQVVCGQFLSLV